MYLVFFCQLSLVVPCYTIQFSASKLANQVASNAILLCSGKAYHSPLPL